MAKRLSLVTAVLVGLGVLMLPGVVSAAFNSYLELTINGTAIEGTLESDGVEFGFAPPGAAKNGKSPQGPRAHELAHVVQQNGKAHQLRLTFTADDPEDWATLVRAALTGEEFSDDGCTVLLGDGPVYRCVAVVESVRFSGGDTAALWVTVGFHEFTPAEEQRKASPRH